MQTENTVTTTTTTSKTCIGLSAAYPDLHDDVSISRHDSTLTVKPPKKPKFSPHVPIPPPEKLDPLWAAHRKMHISPEEPTAIEETIMSQSYLEDSAHTAALYLRPFYPAVSSGALGNLVTDLITKLREIRSIAASNDEVRGCARCRGIGGVEPGAERQLMPPPLDEASQSETHVMEWELILRSSETRAKYLTSQASASRLDKANVAAEKQRGVGAKAQMKARSRTCVPRVQITKENLVELEALLQNNQVKAMLRSPTEIQAVPAVSRVDNNSEERLVITDSQLKDALDDTVKALSSIKRRMEYITEEANNARAALRKHDVNRVFVAAFMNNLQPRLPTERDLSKAMAVLHCSSSGHRQLFSNIEKTEDAMVDVDSYLNFFMTSPRR